MSDKSTKIIVIEVRPRRSEKAEGCSWLTKRALARVCDKLGVTSAMPIQLAALTASLVANDISCGESWPGVPDANNSGSQSETVNQHQVNSWYHPSERNYRNLCIKFTEIVGKTVIQINSLVRLV